MELVDPDADAARSRTPNRTPKRAPNNLAENLSKDLLSKKGPGDFFKSSTQSGFIARGAKLFDMPRFAPVSSQPGRTRHLFRFLVGGKLMLVDLPGYGSTGSAPTKTVNEWTEMVDQ